MDNASPAFLSSPATAAHPALDAAIDQAIRDIQAALGSCRRAPNAAEVQLVCQFVDLANRFSGSRLSVTDLMLAGLGGLAEAFDHYPTVPDDAFLPYAAQWIEEAMRQALATGADALPDLGRIAAMAGLDASAVHNCVVLVLRKQLPQP